MLAKHKSRRTKLGKDPRTGRWCAKLGRKQTKGGRVDGHFFRFSTDERESERRKMKVQEFWDYLVEAWCPGCGARLSNHSGRRCEEAASE